MEKTMKFVFAAILLCGFVAFSSCVEFGHPCPDTPAPPVLCNSSKPYTCQSTPPAPLRCGCSKPAPDMYYDPARDTCVISAEISGCYEFVSGGHLIPVHCTSNAICSSTQIDVEGTCNCISGTLKDEHLCKPGHQMGPCVNNRDCLKSDSSFLQCQSSICMCRDASVWDEVDMQCKGLLGGTCNANPALAPGPCSATMDCTNGHCECKFTHLPTSDGRCLLKLDGDCTNEECHPDFPVCDPSTKVCKCDTNHVPNGGKCYINVNDECNLPDNSATCNPPYTHCNQTVSPNRCLCNDNYAEYNNECRGLLDAICVTTGDGETATNDCNPDFNLDCSVDNRCTCLGGYKAADNGGCLADYNSTCHSETNPCHSDFQCNEGFCGCHDDKLYDEEGHQCRLKHGRECSPTEDICYLYSHCDDSATPPVCTCESNYSPNPVEQICKGNSEASCRPGSTDCNADLYLECKDDGNVCDCRDGYEKQGDGICLGQFNSECRENANCLSQSCLEGVCKCPANKVEYNGQCMVVYGDACDSANECHPLFRLQCSADSNCTCADGMFYEEDRDNGIHRDKCFSGYGKDCTTGADCITTALCDAGKCDCRKDFSPSEGLCVQGGGTGGSDQVHSVAFFTIILSVVVAKYF